MKNKIWLFHIPIIALFTFLLWVNQQGETGQLQNPWLREHLFGFTRRISGLNTNLKFRFRGPQAPKNKVVIVEIDDESLDQEGRWPWHRDKIAQLIESIMQAGPPKSVSLDMVFPEPDQRVPNVLQDLLKSQNMGDLIETLETDFVLQKAITQYRDRLVLGWAIPRYCQPLYDGENCPTGARQPATDGESLDVGKFSFTHVDIPKGFDFRITPASVVLDRTANLPLFEREALHVGSFDAIVDPDGIIRRTLLFRFFDLQPFPTLALEAARVSKKENLGLKLNEKSQAEYVYFEKSAQKLPVTPVGAMEINFRGPRSTFAYVSALQMLDAASNSAYIWPGVQSTLDKVYFDCPSCKLIEVEPGVHFTEATKTDIFKDAHVLIGLSATAAYDMRAFPFDENVPGVEGHANILDNILSGDPLHPATEGYGYWALYLLMIVGGCLFAYFTNKLEAIPAILVNCTIAGLLFFTDFKLLFAKNMNWNTSWLYFEYGFIFLGNLSAKYISEEKNKKFLHGAFSKYVAPAVVNSLIKNPEKLSLGGEKKEITIFFSDIRGFTTLSEKMDAKTLAAFLNDYLGKMTKLVFEHRGTLDKYIGDAVMAFWGAPVDLATHAFDACQSAIAMQKKLDEERPIYLKEFGIHVEAGIGINSGTVNVGNMGSKDNFNYTVIGDDVNLASRLEGITKEYGVSIVVSRATLDLIEKSGNPLPKHRVLDKVKVKGKKNAVEIIELIHRQYSDEGLKLYNDAWSLYLTRKWDQAIEVLNKAKDLIDPQSEKPDGPSERLIKICQIFRQTPPNADWDGSWEMTSK